MTNVGPAPPAPSTVELSAARHRSNATDSSTSPPPAAVGGGPVISPGASSASSLASSRAATPAAASAVAPRGRAYRTYGVGRFRFRLDVNSLEACASVAADYAVYLLGPILICLAVSIIVVLTYTFFAVVLPMIAPDGPLSWGWLFHVSLVVFFLSNVVWNYVLCVCISNKGPHYDRVVRELAEATGFRYPETEEEVEDCKRDYRQKMIERGRARRRQIAVQEKQRQEQWQQQPQPQREHAPTARPSPAGADGAAPAPGPAAPAAASRENGAVGGDGTAAGSGAGGTNAIAPAAAANGGASGSGGRVFGWMLFGPQEWGFCMQTNQPKPPRSHYDHVTKMLVLNMDHYCPWVFNTVGYFTYRYFCNFLLFVFFGMLYGAIITYRPFREMNGPLYFKQIQMSRSEGFKTTRHLIPHVPLPSERTPIAFSFMLCLSVGLAVLCLLVFHLYLTLTAQTTVEFHGNWMKRRRARQRGTSWVNPYDLGWRRNWQQVYGTRHPLVAIMLSRREPEFLPLPIPGERGRRRPKKEKEGPLSISRGEVCGDGSNELDRSRGRGGVAHLV